MMKFLGFSKIGMDFSLQIYFSKFFFFFRKIYFDKFHPQILEKAKNSIISFFHSLNLDGNLFPPEKISWGCHFISSLVKVLSFENSFFLPNFHTRLGKFWGKIFSLKILGKNFEKFFR